MSPQHERGPVVVGVDGSEQALRAVRWAAREAESLETSLQLTSALGYAADVRGSRLMDNSFYESWSRTRGTTWMPPRPPHGQRRGASRSVRRYATVTRAVSGTLLGSVSQAVLHQASCPVAVVRPGTEHDAT